VSPFVRGALINIMPNGNAVQSVTSERPPKRKLEHYVNTSTFTAFDFETANEGRGSPCSLGLVVVENGIIKEKRSWLIRPKELRFNSMNIGIHGIYERDVADQPEFDELWKNEIACYFENKLVVAHNASFDTSVLRTTLALYDLPFPSLTYTCTWLLSKAVWPGLLSYKLGTLAERFQIKFKHHDAEDDAFACALIALRALERGPATELQELSEKFGLVLGRLHLGGYKPAKAKPKSRRKLQPERKEIPQESQMAISPVTGCVSQLI